MKTANCLLALAFLIVLGATAVQAQSSFHGLGFLSQDYHWGYPNAISADGTSVVGICSGRAFRWRENEGYLDLGSPPAPFNGDPEATCVSADGSVVAGFATNYDTKGYPSWA